MNELVYTYTEDMQTLCERVLGYLVMANKLITKKTENLTPRILLLPVGNEIHTKLLQAIGYKIIQKAYYKGKNMTFGIVTQKDMGYTNDNVNNSPKEKKYIHIFSPKAQKTIPICGYKIPCKKLTDYFDDTYFQKKKHPRKLITDDSLYQNQAILFSQLPFLRLLMPKCSILPLQIDTSVTGEEIAKLFLDLYTKDSKIVFLFFSNINIPKEKIPENTTLEEFFLRLQTNKHKITNLVEDNKILQIFFTLGQMLKKPIQPIMYTDENEIGNTQKGLHKIYGVLGI